MKGMKAGSIASVAALLLASTTPVRAQATPTPQDSVYIYYADELFADQSPLPVGLRQLRREDPIINPCRSAETQVAPWLVPLVLFGVKLFGSVVERHLSQREAQRIESMSRTYAQVRAEESFPVQAAGPRMRCLIVDRVSQSSGSFTSGAIYVLALRPVGRTAFTVEPLGGRIDRTPIQLRPRRNQLNATLSVTFQSVAPDSSGTQELVTLPAYSMTFRDLTLSNDRNNIVRPPARRSAVMPIVRNGEVPTSVAVAVTESDASLEQVKQEIALEQANRAALLAAIGEAVKTAITD